MPILKKIVSNPQKRNQYTIIIVDNGVESDFQISVDTFVRHNLYKGMEISTQDLEKIIAEDRIQEAYSAALHYLTYRKRSEKEVREYLLKKEFPSHDIDVTIQRLKNDRYVDDRDFAESYILTAMNTTDKGVEVIRRELETKGIDARIISEKLQIYTDELQIEKAILLAEKYIQRKKQSSLKQLEIQVKDMLRRKGYPFSIIAKAVEPIFREMDGDREQEAIQEQGRKAWKKYRHLPEQERELKVKRYLYRKGFSLDLINDFIHQLQDDM